MPEFSQLFMDRKNCSGIYIIIMYQIKIIFTTLIDNSRLLSLDLDLLLSDGGNTLNLNVFKEQTT